MVSDAPCRAPRRSRAKARCGREAPEPLPPPPRQRGRLSRPEAPSTDECCLDALSRDPFPELVDNPPPLPPLCHGRPGFRYAFTPTALSRREARPFRVSRRSSRPGANGHASLVDFCNRCDPRAPPRMSELRSTAPAVARWCSSLLEARRLSAASRAADGRGLLSQRGQPRCHGSGAARRNEIRFARAAPPTTTARGENFAPTRSARAPHVARS